MPSLLIQGTLQALILSAISNVLAQIIAAQQNGQGFSFDIPTFLFFLTYTLISCPPNILWQVYLEESFPASKPDLQQSGKTRLSKTNTAKKFLLDQSVGAVANTVGYIAALAAFKGKDGAGIIGQVQNDFLPFMQAGWKVWPLVALLSFSVVPLEKRTLFGSTVGLFWGIYMSLLAAK